MSEHETAIGVKCIDHVTLVVNDLEQSKKFYVNGLGMVEVERPGFSFPGLWFQAGDTQIHLILQHDASGPAGDVASSSLRTSRAHHFAFEVEDATEAAKRIEQLGLARISGPQRRPDGFMQVFVSDPDGYIVELCSQS